VLTADSISMYKEGDPVSRDIKPVQVVFLRNATATLMTGE